MRVPAVRVCLPDLDSNVAHRLPFHVRDAAAQLHDLSGSSLMMSAHERQVGIAVARLYTGIERAGYQVGRLAQNARKLDRLLKDLLDIDRPLGKTVELIAERKEVDVHDVVAVVLDRPRHEEGIKAIREAGGRVRLITDGDVSAALLAVAPDRPVDLLWGIGGTPEGVISAAALKCYGGGLIGRLWPRDDDERKAAEDAGYDVDRVLTQDDLVKGDNCFFSATGVTDGDVLEGVRYQGLRGASTESLVMRSRSGTVRRIGSRHDRTKLRALTGRYG